MVHVYLKTNDIQNTRSCTCVEEVEKIFFSEIKQFKFKLLNNIFPSYSTKYRWGMIKSPNCHNFL